MHLFAKPFYVVPQVYMLESFIHIHNNVDIANCADGNTHCTSDCTIKNQDNMKYLGQTYTVIKI